MLLCPRLSLPQLMEYSIHVNNMRVPYVYLSQWVLALATILTLPSRFRTRRRRLSRKTPSVLCESLMASKARPIAPEFVEINGNVSGTVRKPHRSAEALGQPSFDLA